MVNKNNSLNFFENQSNKNYEFNSNYKFEQSENPQQFEKIEVFQINTKDKPILQKKDDKQNFIFRQHNNSRKNDPLLSKYNRCKDMNILNTYRSINEH